MSAKHERRAAVAARANARNDDGPIDPRQIEATIPSKHAAVDAEQATSAQVEAWLQKHGVRYHGIRDVPMGLIDTGRSRDNQARDVALVEDSVRRYTEAYKAGKQLPPIVVYAIGLKTANARFVIIDGNNRQESARRAGMTHIPAFIVSAETPSEKIKAMTVDANAHHGVAPTLDWRLSQAQYLSNIGYTLEDACEFAAVTTAQLNEWRRLTKADERAASHRIPGFKELAKDSRTALGTINDQSVFVGASLCAVETRMSSADVHDFVRSLKKQPSEGERMALIGSIRNERLEAIRARNAVGKGKKARQPLQTTLLSGIGKIQGIDTGTLVTTVITDYDKSIIVERAESTIKKLQEILDAFARVV